ncbi:MAG: hypothetical protein ABIM60_05580 [candidate division WOR-3 bacterium]
MKIKNSHRKYYKYGINYVFDYFFFHCLNRIDEKIEKMNEIKKLKEENERSEKNIKEEMNKNKKRTG